MIRIVKGSYGMVKGKTVVAVQAGSQPIELEPDKEERLVRLGVAEYVGNVEEPDNAGEKEDAESINPGGTDEEQDAEGSDPADQDDADELPPYDESMKLSELKAIAEKYGVDATSMKSKKEVIAAIDEARELPDLSAADPIG